MSTVSFCKKRLRQRRLRREEGMTREALRGQCAITSIEETRADNDDGDDNDNTTNNHLEDVGGSRNGKQEGEGESGVASL